MVYITFLFRSNLVHSVLMSPKVDSGLSGSLVKAAGHTAALTIPSNGYICAPGMKPDIPREVKLSDFPAESAPGNCVRTLDYDGIASKRFRFDQTCPRGSRWGLQKTLLDFLQPVKN